MLEVCVYILGQLKLTKIRLIFFCVLKLKNNKILVNICYKIFTLFIKIMTTTTVFLFQIKICNGGYFFQSVSFSFLTHTHNFGDKKYPQGCTSHLSRGVKCAGSGCKPCGTLWFWHCCMDLVPQSHFSPTHGLRALTAISQPPRLINCLFWRHPWTGMQNPHKMSHCYRVCSHSLADNVFADETKAKWFFASFCRSWRSSITAALSVTCILAPICVGSAC